MAHLMGQKTNSRSREMCLNGITLYEISDITKQPDRAPIYIEFQNEGTFKNQWGIVDQNRHVTIHKDFTLSFNDRCKYYGLSKEDSKNPQKAVIVKF